MNGKSVILQWSFQDFGHAANKAVFFIHLKWHFRCKLIKTCGQCHN